METSNIRERAKVNHFYLSVITAQMQESIDYHALKKLLGREWVGRLNALRNASEAYIKKVEVSNQKALREGKGDEEFMDKLYDHNAVLMDAMFGLIYLTPERGNEVLALMDRLVQEQWAEQQEKDERS